MRSVHLNKLRTEAWISSGILVAFFVFTLIKHDNLHIVLTAGLLVIQVLLSPKGYFPRMFHFLFPITAVIFMLGSKYVLNLYETVGWYDKFVHLLATFVMTLLLGFLATQTTLKAAKSQPLVFVIVIASLGISLGVAWEVVEWLFEFIAPKVMNVGTHDLITDLLVDSIGAVLAAVVCLSLHKRIN